MGELLRATLEAERLLAVQSDQAAAPAERAATECYAPADAGANQASLRLVMASVKRIQEQIRRGKAP